MAIEVDGAATLHDAGCRDAQNPSQWTNTAITVSSFKAMLEKGGSIPYGWHGKYNEHVVPDFVSPDRIVAYAKVEKELPIEAVKPTAEQLKQVQNYLSKQLSFATQFEDPADNILLSEKEGGGMKFVFLSIRPK